MSTVVRFRPESFTPRSAVRSLWLEEAMASNGAGARQTAEPPLPARADVCIVGGGFTGLWTAIRAKTAEPSADVVVIEADVCGGGASGRNGGFIMTAWSKFSSLKKVCGASDALRYAEAAEAAVAGIGSFCAEHGIDADFRQGGWLWAATNRAQIDAWQDAMSEVADVGAAPYEPLDPDEVARRSGSPVHLAGIFEAAAGTIQPARLARGLAARRARAGRHRPRAHADDRAERRRHAAGDHDARHAAAPTAWCSPSMRGPPASRSCGAPSW